MEASLETEQYWAGLQAGLDENTVVVTDSGQKPWGQVLLTRDQIVFAGNASGLAAAQGLLVAGDNKVQGVFDTASHVAWFDLDDNAVLNDADLSIYLPNTPTMTAHDVDAGAFIA